MPPGHSDRDGEDDDTPPTRSYVDALLHGNLSVDQVADLRAGIAGRAEAEAARPEPRPSAAPTAPFSGRPPSLPPTSQRLLTSRPSTLPPTSPRSYGAAPPTLPPTSPRSYGAAPPTLPPTSRPAPATLRGTSRPPPLPADPWPITLPPIEDYGSSYGPGPVVDPRVEPVDDPEDLRTLARSYAPEPADPEDMRTLARSYAPSPTDSDDDEPNLTAVHIYSAVELADLVELGDLDGLGGDIGHTPAPHARRVAAAEYDALLDQTYLAALGGPATVPSLAVAPPRVIELSLGPQVAFVLSCVDGASSVEDVLDISGLARLETLRILYDLLQDGVIRVPT